MNIFLPSTKQYFSVVSNFFVTLNSIGLVQCKLETLQPLSSTLNTGLQIASSFKQGRGDKKNSYSSKMEIPSPASNNTDGILQPLSPVI